ncbi:MAG: type I 3-dehydroquinate dehydratase, partial [Clostridiales bacterium]|nr:type I 3-dehydroquinate dehydratase [Candidatus Blautia equi]
MTKAIQIKNMSLGSGFPKICVPLTGKTYDDLKEEAKAVLAAAPDLVEWRGDAYADLCDIEKTLETLDMITGILGDIPVLFTIRTTHEGGMADISIEEYGAINLAVAKAKKAPLVDVEIFWEKDAKIQLIKDLQSEGAVIIASSHDFQKTDAPEVLKARFMEMDKTGADVL